MKNKKGFTLIELLAVIVVLAIIMVIAGSNLMETKKKANIAEAKKIEKMIEDLGPIIYSYENMKKNTSYTSFYYEYNERTSIDSYIYVKLGHLYSGDYLKSDTIKNPSGNGNCDGYLLVQKTDEGPKFYGKINCPGVYTSESYGRWLYSPVTLTP